jgi:hypothetical protein
VRGRRAVRGQYRRFVSSPSHRIARVCGVCAAGAGAQHPQGIAGMHQQGLAFSASGFGGFGAGAFGGGVGAPVEVGGFGQNAFGTSAFMGFGCVPCPGCRKALLV